MNEDKYILTRAGYEKLKRELDQLINVDSVEVAALVEEAHEDEDGEDATFYDAMVAKERLDSRIAELRNILVHAEVIDEDADPDIITPGNRVIVWDIEEKEELVFDLRGSAEVAHGLKGVSISSPVGQALQGRKVGDVVEVEVPMGTVRYKVRAIEVIPDET